MLPLLLLVFPNQLFDQHPGFVLNPSRVIVCEDSLFFGDARYPANFHQQKLWLHRASMKRYAASLAQRGIDVAYSDACSLASSSHASTSHLSLLEQLRRATEDLDIHGQTLAVVDPVDFVLNMRLRVACESLGLTLRILPNPGFFNSTDDNIAYRSHHKRWFMADFYKSQRKRLNLLMDGNEPVGGQWSFDEQNRKKVPKKLLSTIPPSLKLARDAFDEEAVAYVESHYPHHPGSLQELHYPTSHADARRWLQYFLEHRFQQFGDYEDAIVEGESWLWHSVLTPSLNIGLLTPAEIIQEVIAYSETHDVPLNSLEGFIRQIIGWREFMRATYEDLGVKMRTKNHWGHNREMPTSFYDATTGIAPIDDTIKRLLRTGYCHHIERLMVLGGFMFLCEINPNAVYRWFMEMFVDSYDWVMVPNVYAMSQNADGGLITTKPYFSGSSYVRKMSHHKQDAWCDVWDGLYWRWIWNHSDELAKNPRWAMMCSAARKMDAAKRNTHLENAERFLAQLKP